MDKRQSEKIHFEKAKVFFIVFQRAAKTNKPKIVWSQPEIN